MATKLLPAVKRYAVSTEPVREAAKVTFILHTKSSVEPTLSYQFWTSFYEKSAQVHIPAYEDYSSLHEQQSETTSQTESSSIQLNAEATSQFDNEDDTTPSHPHSRTYDPHSTASESSFMPSNAVSSTPARAGFPHNHTMDQPSWSASLESPLVRLDRELQNFTLEEGSKVLASPDTTYLAPRHLPDPPLPPKRQPYERSPRKPYPPMSSTSDSSSALDMRSYPNQSTATPRAFDQFNDSFDDSAELMRGLSPPRTVAFARAPRSSVGLGLIPPLGRTPGKDLLPALGRTPGKEAAERIRRDLLGSVQSEHSSVRSSATIDRFGGFKKFGYIPEGTEDTMSTIPTPPSITRYTRHAYPSAYDNDPSSSLASMMRKAGLSAPDSVSRSQSQQSFDTARLAPPPQPRALYTPDQHPDSFHFQPEEPSTIQPGGPRLDCDSDSDSLSDEPAHPGQPSTAFLMASARNPNLDDSFGSSNSNHSSDSIGEDFGEEGGAVHPFARAVEGEGDGFDDSFDSADGDGLEVPEETVFGIPPAQRHKGRGPSELRLLGEDLLQDTIGIGSQLAKAGRVEESPTPYGR